MQWSRFIAYSLKLQTATWRSSIGSAIFWQMHTRKKTLAVLSSWTNALKIRHQDKETAKTAWKKIIYKTNINRVQTSLRSMKWNHAVEPGTTEGKSMEQLGKGHDPRTKTLSSQTSSYILLYLSLMHYAFFVELHFFSFLFVASVYFLLASRGKVRLHNYWPH